MMRIDRRPRTGGWCARLLRARGWVPLFLLAAGVLTGFPSEAKHKLAAERCEAEKIEAVAENLHCRMDLTAKSILNGTEPEFDRCQRTFERSLAKADRRYGDACPTTNDAATLSVKLDTIIQEITDSLSGDAEIDLVFLQQATTASYDGDVLTLAGVSADTVFLSDQERLVETSDLITIWQAGQLGSSIEADLVCTTDWKVVSVELELSDPSYDADNLEYDVADNDDSIPDTCDSPLLVIHATASDDGPNPCCSWEASGNCSQADSLTEVWNNAPTVFQGNDGTGAYSQACNTYIRQCTDGSATGVPSWLIGTTLDLSTTLSAQSDWLPEATKDLDDIKSKAEVLLPVWQTNILDDPRTQDLAKSMGAGTANDAYMAIYNCRSPFEIANVDGCDGDILFNLTPEFIGAMTDGTERFELYQPHFEDAGDPAFTQPVPSYIIDGPFNLEDRHWFQFGMTLDVDDGPTFTTVYQNYETEHPVFAYVSKYVDQAGVDGVTLALQYLGDEPAYLAYDSACMIGGAP